MVQILFRKIFQILAPLTSRTSVLPITNVRCTGRYSEVSMGSHRAGWLFCRLVLLLILCQTAVMCASGIVASDDPSVSSSPSFSSVVLSELSYPSVKIGPYSFRYFRVEVPRAFSELSITLTRQWLGEHIEDHESKVPMVCFRFGAPPSPDSTLESLQAAALAAGKAQNVSEFGKCAWFYSNSSVILTNMQIISGVWYMGVFSDSLPSRYQSKMISRGSVYNFGVQLTVFGCSSPTVVGHNCNVSITQLYAKAAASSNPSSGHHHEHSQVGEESWISLPLQHVGPGAWKYFSLDVTAFAAKLEVRVECMSPNCGLQSPESNTWGLGPLYLKYGTLPDQSDEATAVGSSSVATSAPRRGIWYIGVLNSNMSTPLEFSLYWRLDSCSDASGWDTCRSAMQSLKRVLLDDTYESPFDSYYGPVARDGGSLHPPWIPMGPSLSNSSGGNWTHYLVDVPHGAAGAVLSVDLRHVVGASVAVYARFEGLAAPNKWDCKAVLNLEDDESLPEGKIPPEIKSKQDTLSLNLVYPPEGIWCVGIRYSHASPTSSPVAEFAEEGQGREVQMHVRVHGCVNKCSGQGRCLTSYESSRLQFFSYCHCDEAHGGIDCSVPLVVPIEQALHIWTLIGSNVAAVLPSLWAHRHRAYSEWVVFTACGVSSSVYHSCDAGGWCALSYDTLQFLDFWLSFLAVVMTCLYLTSFNQTTKAAANIGAAIITATVTKENATSAWNVLLVVLMGVAGLVLGWTLDCGKLHMFTAWLGSISPSTMIRVDALYSRGEQFLNRLKSQFRWFYLTTGLGILLAAGMSWVLETDDTYWIWHSLWHVSIYTSAFLVLRSTTKAPWASNVESVGYEQVVQHATHTEVLSVIRDTVEMDAFSIEHDRSR